MSAYQPQNSVALGAEQPQRAPGAYHTGDAQTLWRFPKRYAAEQLLRIVKRVEPAPSQFTIEGSWRELA